MSRVDWVPGWYERVDHEVDKFMEKIAKDVYHVMMVKVPVRTGHLKEDLDWEYNKATKTARVGAVSVPYAIYVEEGTKPHLIEPNDPKKALWWVGAQHPVYKVNHPGATATHFMKESLYSERRP
jgi:hypothetical protein